MLSMQKSLVGMVLSKRGLTAMDGAYLALIIVSSAAIIFYGYFMIAMLIYLIIERNKEKRERVDRKHVVELEERKE